MKNIIKQELKKITLKDIYIAFGEYIDGGGKEVIIDFRQKTFSMNVYENGKLTLKFKDLIRFINNEIGK